MKVAIDPAGQHVGTQPIGQLVVHPEGFEVHQPRGAGNLESVLQVVHVAEQRQLVAQVVGDFLLVRQSEAIVVLGAVLRRLVLVPEVFGAHVIDVVLAVIKLDIRHAVFELPTELQGIGVFLDALGNFVAIPILEIPR